MKDNREDKVTLREGVNLTQYNTSWKNFMKAIAVFEQSKKEITALSKEFEILRDGDMIVMEMNCISQLPELMRLKNKLCHSLIAVRQSHETLSMENFKFVQLN